MDFCPPLAKNCTRTIRSSLGTTICTAKAAIPGVSTFEGVGHGSATVELERVDHRRLDLRQTILARCPCQLRSGKGFRLVRIYPDDIDPSPGLDGAGFHDEAFASGRRSLSEILCPIPTVKLFLRH